MNSDDFDLDVRNLRPPVENYKLHLCKNHTIRACYEIHEFMNGSWNFRKVATDGIAKVRGDDI